MPSPHPRIGLVVDEQMSEALRVLREPTDEDLPQAGLARRAVFGGVALGAIVHEARSASGHRDAALRLLHDLRALLQSVRLPSAVRTGLLEVASGWRRWELPELVRPETARP